MRGSAPVPRRSRPLRRPAGVFAGPGARWGDRGGTNSGTANVSKYFANNIFVTDAAEHEVGVDVARRLFGSDSAAGAASLARHWHEDGSRRGVAGGQRRGAGERAETDWRCYYKSPKLRLMLRSRRATSSRRGRPLSERMMVSGRLRKRSYPSGQLRVHSDRRAAAPRPPNPSASSSVARPARSSTHPPREHGPPSDGTGLATAEPPSPERDSRACERYHS